MAKTIYWTMVSINTLVLARGTVLILRTSHPASEMQTMRRGRIHSRIASIQDATSVNGIGV